MPPLQTQSSFIPRKPSEVEQLAGPPRGGMGFVTVVSLVVFLVSALSAGGAYVYEQYLKQGNKSKETTLLKVKTEFEPEIILDLQALGQRIEVANGLLASHPALTLLLSALGESTLQTVQFTKLTYVRSGTKLGIADVSLEGRAQSFSSVALQSDEFGKSRAFKNPIFSGIVPVATAAGGGVRFSVKLEADMNVLSYQKTVAAQ